MANADDEDDLRKAVAAAKELGKKRKADEKGGHGHEHGHSHVHEHGHSHEHVEVSTGAVAGMSTGTAMGGHRHESTRS